MTKEKAKSDREEKTEEFVDKAAGLFAKKGYRQVGVQEIINHLGLSKGGFYWYFSSKLDLYSQTCKVHCARNRQMFVDMLGGGEITMLTLGQAALGLLERFLDNPDHIRLMIDFHHEDNCQPIREQLQELDREWTRVLSLLIQRGQEEEVLPASTPAETLARQCVIFFTGLIMNYDVHRNKDAVRQEWQFFLSSLFALKNLEGML